MESHAYVTLRGSHCPRLGDWCSPRIRSDPADSHLPGQDTHQVCFHGGGSGETGSPVWQPEPRPRTPTDQPSASGPGGTGGHVSRDTDPPSPAGNTVGVHVPLREPSAHWRHAVQMRPPLALHVGPLEDGQLAWGLSQTSRGFLWAHHDPPEPKNLAHSPHHGSP